MPLVHGTLLNKRYKILEELGQGGMGAVYKAIDENLGVTVAVKENFFLTDEYACQFQREAKILASLRHPNLPRVLDYFVIEQQGQYLVMDYIEGDDLREWIERKEVISEVEVIQIGTAICNALIYLHSRQPAIVHRDIKPGNVKITPDGEVVLVDFGLVKVMLSGEVTSVSARAMTPGYSPPEQYGAAPTDTRTDIFSLGATLYATLTSMIPEDSLERATSDVKLTPVRRITPRVSKRLAKVIEKSLEIRFEDRYQTAQEFKAALLKAYDNSPGDKVINDQLGGEDLKEQPIVESSVLTAKSPRKRSATFRWIRHILQSIGAAWFLFSAILLSLLIILFSSALSFDGVSGTSAQAQASATITQSNLLAMSGLDEIDIGAVINGRKESQTPIVISAKPSAMTFDMDSLPVSDMDSLPVSEEIIIPPPLPTPTALGGSAGVLAFVSDRSGLPQIWLSDISRQSEWQITDMQDGACQPAWSPDGEQLVFISPCPGKRSTYTGSSLYTIDVDGQNLKRLPPSLEGDYDPAWSPDGTQIAYTSLFNGLPQICLFNLKDLSIECISDGNYPEHQPAWSKDGTLLAFIRRRYSNEIWIMNPDGSNVRQFSLSGTLEVSSPTWNEDDSVIIFNQQIVKGNPSPILMGMRFQDIGKSVAYKISPSDNADLTYFMNSPDASPDGYWVAFEYWYDGGNHDIYILAMPGANLTRITIDEGNDYDPVWRPLP